MSVRMKICGSFLLSLVTFFILSLCNTANAEVKSVAVLEFQSNEIDRRTLLLLSDEARGGLREGLSIDKYNIISRENLFQILSDMGKTIEECSSECEVTLGREIGADYVLSGNLIYMEGAYILAMKLHSTHTASLLSQKRVESTSVRELLAKTNATAKRIATEKINPSEMINEKKDISVKFDASPLSEVTILVSGQAICMNVSTCTEKVSSGMHEVQFAKKGYFTDSQNVYLKEGMVVKANLKPQFSQLRVRSSPRKLSVQVNNKKIALDKFLRREPGVYTVILNDPCYREEGIEITLESGDKETVLLQPKPKKSGIDVEVYDSEGNAVPGEIYVDGKFLGESPLRTEVPKCSKRLRVLYNTQKAERPLHLQEHLISPVKVKLPPDSKARTKSVSPDTTKKKGRKNKRKSKTTKRKKRQTEESMLRLYLGSEFDSVSNSYHLDYSMIDWQLSLTLMPLVKTKLEFGKRLYASIYYDTSFKADVINGGQFEMWDFGAGIGFAPQMNWIFQPYIAVGGGIRTLQLHGEEIEQFGGGPVYFGDIGMRYHIGSRLGLYINAGVKSSTNLRFVREEQSQVVLTSSGGRFCAGMYLRF
ncbi:MAG: hypothetical protein VX278_07610 [Myxococcota bacterium]|nr:hypothetical protein [Myxococcota bacterium]